MILADDGLHDAALVDLARLPTLWQLNVANNAVTLEGLRRFAAASPDCELFV